MHRQLDWLFENRQDGGYTVVQRPNLPALVMSGWAIAALVSRRRVVVLIAALWMTIWGGMELVDGVNPFRRLLGALGALMASAAAIWSRNSRT